MNPIVAKMTDSGWTGIVIGYMEGGMEMEHIYTGQKVKIVRYSFEGDEQVPIRPSIGDVSKVIEVGRNSKGKRVLILEIESHFKTHWRVYETDVVLYNQNLEKTIAIPDRI